MAKIRNNTARDFHLMAPPAKSGEKQLESKLIPAGDIVGNSVTPVATPHVTDVDDALIDATKGDPAVRGWFDSGDLTNLSAGGAVARK